MPSVPFDMAVVVLDDPSDGLDQRRPLPGLPSVALEAPSATRDRPASTLDPPNAFPEAPSAAPAV